MYEDMSYSMLDEMMKKKFNLEANDRLNLSVKLPSFDSLLHITGDDEEALDLVVRLKALEDGYHFLSKKSNPDRKNRGTVTRIKTNEEGVFEMLFIALVASIRTSVNHLRPLLIIDAAHLKGQYKGTNLLAVGMDGNNQIVPILLYAKGKSVYVGHGGCSYLKNA
ncbi:hypothetical protein Tco_1028320 [Tanacetum coccineum]|uniref:Transposase n=1 Tax=Tanacetum coccineum TaxID=301880 RepID=A0ABQ5G1U5_9ASTR